MEIIRNLRLGEFDVLVGINLLREGLDIPEVSLVAILDADKEGFLRSERSLIQTIGRAARNTDGTVIMYGDELTESMEKAIKETNRRRAIQEEYNKEHNITPKTVVRKNSKWKKGYWEIDINGTVDPYKYSRSTSMGDWLWDPFVFETDVAWDYADVTVSGDKAITIAATRMPITPIFNCSAPMTMIVDEDEYKLPKGTSTIPGMILTNVEKEFVFVGTGTVTVSAANKSHDKVTAKAGATAETGITPVVALDVFGSGADALRLLFGSVPPPT